MIENVEGFKTEFEQFRFREVYVLQQPHIPVIQPRAVEEAPVGISNLSGVFFAKEGCIEVRLARSRIGIVYEFSRSVVRDVRSNGSGKGDVISFGKLDGQAGGESSDARDLPAAHDFLGPAPVGMEKFIEGQLSAVADDKIMLHVEEAEPPTDTRIVGIGGVLEAGRVIQALAIRIAKKKFTPGAGVTKGGLKGMIRRIGDGLFVGIASKGDRVGIAGGIQTGKQPRGRA